MTDMTPEQALQKLLATAEGNPFCPVGHLVEHGLGGADALRAALSRPTDTEASRTLDALIALAAGDDGLPDDMRADVERLRARLGSPAVPVELMELLDRLSPPGHGIAMKGDPTETLHTGHDIYLAQRVRAWLATHESRLRGEGE